MLLQRCIRDRINGKRVFWVDVDSSYEQYELTKDMVQKCMIMPLQLIPPSLHKWKLGDATEVQGRGSFLVKHPASEALDLVTFAATRAFHNMNKEQMQFCHKSCCPTVPKETKLGGDAYARHLMTHILKDWSDAQISDAIVAWRGNKPKKEVVEALCFYTGVTQLY